MLQNHSHKPRAKILPSPHKRKQELASPRSVQECLERALPSRGVRDSTRRCPSGAKCVATVFRAQRCTFETAAQETQAELVPLWARGGTDTWCFYCMPGSLLEIRDLLRGSGVICFPRAGLWLGWRSELGVLLVQLCCSESSEACRSKETKGREKEGGEWLACSHPEGKHKSSNLQYSACSLSTHCLASDVPDRYVWDSPTEFNCG